jgi:hypothetical protein
MEGLEVMRTTLLTLVVLLLGAPVLLLRAGDPQQTRSAGEGTGWAEKMFKDASHDFGNVPRGAQLYHRFTITNIYAVTMEITDIKPGCTCTTATPSKRVLAPRESATIDVSVDATRFTGPKTVDIKVSVGPEFISTAVLKVTANSRADLVFNPGEISFGTVTAGQLGNAAEQTIDVDYAGALDWKVTEIVARDLPLETKLEKLTRSAGQVGYRVTAKLKKDAPVGTLKEEVYLKTNDPNSPLVPIVVEAVVQAPVVVTPNAFNLGGVKVGEAVTRRVVVRGTKAFKVVSVDGLGNGLELGNQLTTDEAAVHTIVFKCQIDKAGEFKRDVKIRTSMPDVAPVVVTIEGAGQQP